jgi:hypothetical protein
MDPFRRSQSNERRRFTPDVGNFAVAIAIHFALRLLFGAIALS